MEKIDLRKYLFLLDKKETLTDFACLIALKYWDIDFVIPVLVKPLSKNKYGHYCSNYIRDERGKVIGYTPTKIEINTSAFSNLTKFQLMDLLKHEVCHYACQQLGKPNSDGSKFFEQELVRINASTTHIGYGKGFRERSKKKQKEMLKKKRLLSITEGNKGDSIIKNIQIYRIYQNGKEKYQFSKQEDRLIEKESNGYWRDYMPYRYTFSLIFDLEKVNYTCQIHMKHDGKWAISNKRHGIYQTEYYGKKLNLERKGLLFLREKLIEKAEQLVNELKLK